MTEIVVFGPPWSAYTRTVLLTLLEKAVVYRLEEVDFLQTEMPEEQTLRHPFAKVPAFRHGNYQLYETAAICRYIDEAFTGQSLQPSNPALRGRMTQIVCILDAYLSEPARMGFASELLVKPLMGSEPDMNVVRQAQTDITKSFEAIDDCIEPGEFMIGDDITLADLHAVPMIDYINKTPGGSALIARFPRIDSWWRGIKCRPSVVQTQPDLSVFSSAGKSYSESTLK